MRVEVYPEPDKLGKQMKYAATRSIPFAAILGADEIARGEVAIKNLSTGEQVSMPRTQVRDVVTRLSPEARPERLNPNLNPRTPNPEP